MRLFQPMHSAAEYTRMLLNLFPTGPAFPRTENNSIFKLMQGHGDELVRLDNQINLLTKEAFYNLAEQLIDEWEKAAGLPNDVFTIPPALADRRALLIFLLKKISEYIGQHGLSENFWYAIAADPILNYTITGINYFDAARIGPSEFYTGVCDTTVSDNVLRNIADTSDIIPGHYLTIKKDFPLGEFKVLSKTVDSVTVDQNAIGSGVTVPFIGYEGKPFGMGDGLGSAFLFIMEITIDLLAGSPPYSTAAADTTAGSKDILNCGSLTNVSAGDFILTDKGFTDPVQVVTGKAGTTLTVQDAAASTESGVSLIKKSQDNDLIENFSNWIKPAKTILIFKYT